MNQKNTFGTTYHQTAIRQHNITATSPQAHHSSSVATATQQANSSITAAKTSMIQPARKGYPATEAFSPRQRGAQKKPRNCGA